MEKDKFLLIRTPEFIKIVDDIDQHVDYVDRDPLFDNQLSRGIIDRALIKAYNDFGCKVANDLIDTFRLVESGWQKFCKSEDNI